MIPNYKTMTITLNRTIPASPAEVYDAWLDPATPGTPWDRAECEKVILDAKIDGLFYFKRVSPERVEFPHFGRFVILEPAKKIEYTWMSPFTHGVESVVTVELEKKGDDTCAPAPPFQPPRRRAGAHAQRGLDLPHRRAGGAVPGAAEPVSRETAVRDCPSLLPAVAGSRPGACIGSSSGAAVALAEGFAADDLRGHQRLNDPEHVARAGGDGAALAGIAPATKVHELTVGRALATWAVSSGAISSRRRSR